MKSLSENAIRLARVLIAIVFVLNAIGVIDQTIPAKEMMERGVPAAIVPWLMFAGGCLSLLLELHSCSGFSREQQLWRSWHS
jgi:hypothetical protein